jgi:ATP-dependent DNA ligase
LNRGFAGPFMRLKFLPPLMPTLVAKPPEGDGHDLRDMALEDRREILVGMIPAGGRIQFRKLFRATQSRSSICLTKPA